MAGRAGCCVPDPKHIAKRSRLAEAIRRSHATFDGGAATALHPQPRLPAGEIIGRNRGCGSATLAHPIRKCTAAAAGGRHQCVGGSSAFVGIIHGREKKVASPHPATWQFHGLPAFRNRHSHAHGITKRYRHLQSVDVRRCQKEPVESAQQRYSLRRVTPVSRFGQPCPPFEPLVGPVAPEHPQWCRPPSGVQARR
jgi:hypothetical protein